MGVSIPPSCGSVSNRPAFALSRVFFTCCRPSAVMPCRYFAISSLMIVAVSNVALACTCVVIRNAPGHAVPEIADLVPTLSIFRHP